MRTKIALFTCLLSGLALSEPSLAATTPKTTMADIAGTWDVSIAKTTAVAGLINVNAEKNGVCTLTEVSPLKGNLTCEVTDNSGNTNSITGKAHLINNGKELMWTLDASTINNIESGIAGKIATQVAHDNGVLQPGSVHFSIGTLSYQPITVSATHALGQGGVTIKGSVKAVVNGKAKHKNFAFSATISFLSRQ